MQNYRMVRDGKVWAAAGVSAGIDLAFALFGEIAGQEAAEIAQLIIEYDPQPPFNAGHPSKASDTVRTKAKAEMVRLSNNPRNYIAVLKLLWRNAIDRSRKKNKAARKLAIFYSTERSGEALKEKTQSDQQLSSW